MKQPTQSRTVTGKQVILFLAANPAGTAHLALDREARAIHAELKRTGYRDRFDFVTRWAVEPLDLLRELRELRPVVVHVSGHGTAAMISTHGSTCNRDVVDGEGSRSDPGGVYVHGAGGTGQLVSAEAIAQTLAAVGSSVQLVVLNACFAEAIAEALLAQVDCVVGMSGAIHDDAARIFAIGFYGGLGEGESIARAFEQGRAAINLEGLPDAARPQLQERPDSGASEAVLADPSTRWHDVPCPYPGMRPYTADDADGFHGRDAEIDELIGRLRAGEREIYVIGPSGSGKSSLVAAGVLPRLARGAAGLGPFVVQTMRPGEQPAARLSEVMHVRPGQKFVAADCIAAVLAHRARGSSVLLVVDQLEELFTVAHEGERAAFLTALRALRDERRFVVIVTLRADFFGALMESPLWPERGREQLSLVKVGPLRGEALREAIATPACAAGVSVEPDLLHALVAEVASEPGILPLLQETMVQLWDKRTDQTLTLADYQALGDGERSGLAVALAHRADVTLRKLTPTQAAIARRISLRLISFGEGRPDTRRQQPCARLRAAADDAADFALVLKTMVDDRLLTMDEDDRSDEARVDLAHEVMIAAWPALVDWVRTHRVDEQKRRKLEAAAIEWAEHGRGARGLLDAIELADAERWQESDSAAQLGQSTEVDALIAASRKAYTKQRRLRQAVLATVSLLLAIIAYTASSVAHAQEQELQRDVLRTNAYAAHGLAGAVAFHLRENLDAALATAADPEVVRAFHNQEEAALEQGRVRSGFDTIALYDRSGIARVQSSPLISRVRNIGKDYSWRDYFRGARRLGEAGLRAGYISRALRSESEGTWMFGVAVPVYEEGTWAGVLLATIGTDSLLRQRRLARATDAGPMAVVVAPRDRSRATTEGEGDYVVILHDGLSHGAGIVMDSPRLRALRATRTEQNQLRWIDPEPIMDDAHRDPVPGFEGRWLAGFAPVGDTGFVVIVQTRYDTAVAPNARLWRSFAWQAGPIILAMMAAAILWIYHPVLLRGLRMRHAPIRA